MADFELGALADTIHRPRLNGQKRVRYLCMRGWRADRKGDQVAAVKAQKKMLRPPFVAAAARELAQALRGLFGPLTTASVTSVPCGHSRRPDCAGAQIAAAAALNLGADHRPRFRNRFCRGVSHPKENARLPPIAIACRAIIIDASPSPWSLSSTTSPRPTGTVRRRSPRCGEMVWPRSGPHGFRGSSPRRHRRKPTTILRL